MKRLSDYGTGMKSILMAGLDAQADRLTDQKLYHQEQKERAKDKLTFVYYNMSQAQAPAFYYKVRERAKEMLEKWKDKEHQNWGMEP